LVSIINTKKTMALVEFHNCLCCWKPEKCIKPLKMDSS
jgi:hypothetical protein